MSENLEDIKKKAEIKKQKDPVVEKAKRSVIMRLSMKIHFISYILVNLLLFAINFSTDFTYQWYLWSVTGWGIGLVTHAFAYFTTMKKSFGRPATEGLAYHLFIYVIVSAFLVFVNLFTFGGNYWVLWVIGGWGLGLIFHLYLYNTRKPKKDEDPKKSWMDRKIEKEMGNAA